MQIPAGTRVAVLAIFGVAITPLLISQESTAGLPTFDVAAVKLGSHPHTPEGYSWSDVKVQGPGRFRAVNANLHELVQWAYNIKDYQIDEPDWLKSNSITFDIEATAPTAASVQQVRLMLQRLLAERFEMVIHHETKTMPVYVLTVNQGRPKLKSSTQDTPTGIESRGSSSTVRMSSTGTTMARLASALSGSLDRPVLDHTELTGIFAIQLEYARLGSSDSDAHSIFAALQDLGLKLEATRAPFEMIKVEHANPKPTTN